MPSTKMISAGALLVLLHALSAYSFHVEYGTECSTVGAACSYVSNDSSTGGSATTTVNGFCAPDLHCASQGAKCDDDDSCFNYCGTDGTCGGEGAGCNTQAAFLPGQAGIACDSEAFACTATGGSVGQCLPKDQVKIQAVDETDDSTEEPASPAASQANARRTKRRLSDSLDAYMNHQVRSSDLRRAFARHAPRKHA